MQSLPVRIVRALAAGVLGAIGWLALFALILAVGLVLTQAMLLWHESGIFRLFPEQAEGAVRPTDVVIADATDSQAAAIRTALAGLAYRLPLRAITIRVTPEACVNCGAEYLPGLGVVRIERDLVDQKGLALQHALAHEIGHYVDDYYLDDTLRARFMRMRGIPARYSWISAERPWEDRPIEDFAEVFAILNMATTDRPIETSYGPLRNPSDFVGLLRSAGVALGRPTAPPDWELLLIREIAFAKYTGLDPRLRTIFWSVVLLYGLAGAVHSTRASWRR